MPYRKATARAGFALLVLGISLAASQSERRRQFDVPYVPTTEEAVRATLATRSPGCARMAAAWYV
jgi:galactokinase